jgi:hypothetical protein
MKRVRPARSQTVDVGSIFGRLIAIERMAPTKCRQAVWRCRCECGIEKEIRASSLMSGITSSCGCLRREIQPKIRLVHGDKPKRNVAPEYTAWTNMITRCANPKHNRWQHYGGRGIAVCRRWRASYQDFLADVGRRPSPGHSIDRYPDCDGNYEPGNVRWATAIEQRANQRRMKAA